MAHDQHVRAAKDVVARCGVITLSDTRTPDSDASGRMIRTMLTDVGHLVARYELIPDDPGRLTPLLAELLADGDVDAIVTNGGTGVARRDQTVDVVERTITQPLPGFGELFRMLSWEQVGAAAMLSRAVGGIAHDASGRGKPIFALPGSTKAVELAMSKLVLPVVRHILWELRN